MLRRRRKEIFSGSYDSFPRHPLAMRESHESIFVVQLAFGRSTLPCQLIYRCLSCYGG